MGRNFNGAQINNSSTIVEKAGEEIIDCRNRIMKYDDNGNVVLATSGTDNPVGVAIIEAGCNDISGEKSGNVAKGDDIDIQIKDIGFVIAGEDIEKGQEVAAGEKGMAAVAAEGGYVLGMALNTVSANGYCKILFSKYRR